MKRALLLLFILISPGPAFAQARELPDDTLTPGAADDVAHHGARPSLSAAERRWINDQYGIHRGDVVAEYDHRIPFGCGGRTDRTNIWPQDRSKVAKDRLEHWFERQVTLGNLGIEDCQQAFMAPNDWRDRYRAVYGKEP